MEVQVLTKSEDLDQLNKSRQLAIDIHTKMLDLTEYWDVAEVSMRLSADDFYIFLYMFRQDDDNLRSAGMKREYFGLTRWVILDKPYVFYHTFLRHRGLTFCIEKDDFTVTISETFGGYIVEPRKKQGFWERLFGK